MATTSTLPTVKARLVTVLTTALATSSASGGQVQVSYAWPGPATLPEVVFLGRHPDLVANPLTEATRLRSDLAAIKAGRKSRDEEYDIPVTIWNFQPALRPEDAATAQARGFAVYQEIEDVLADDPRIGLGTAIKSAVIGDVDVSLVPFETGWASVIVPTVTVEARLT